MASRTSARTGTWVRAFFVVGKQYRAPMFVATSAERDIAFDFMRRQKPTKASTDPPFQDPILWVFHFDPKRRCSNVNLIDKNDGKVGNEFEFLFSPYSSKKVWTVFRYCIINVIKHHCRCFYM